MRLLREKYNFDRAVEQTEEFNLYPVGTEVLLTQVVDDVYLYCFDKIREINITDEGGVVYYFEDAEMAVKDKDLIPYTIKNEHMLKDLGYEHTRDGHYMFTDYTPV